MSAPGLHGVAARPSMVVAALVVLTQMSCKPSRDAAGVPASAPAVVGTTAAGSAGPGPSPTAATVTTLPAESVVAVYYFHRTMRCPTCLRIEELARDAVQHGFEEERAAGRVTWQVFNLDQPENQHFETDFNLKVQSLIIVRSAPGQPPEWVDMADIWDLVEDPPNFTRYVQKGVRRCLEGKPTSPPPPEKDSAS